MAKRRSHCLRNPKVAQFREAEPKPAVIRPIVTVFVVVAGSYYDCTTSRANPASTPEPRKPKWRGFMLWSVLGFAAAKLPVGKTAAELAVLATELYGIVDTTIGAIFS